jgi:hypothetical protein
VLYWASLALFAMTGGFLLFAVAGVLLSPQWVESPRWLPTRKRTLTATTVKRTY